MVLQCAIKRCCGRVAGRPRKMRAPPTRGSELAQTPKQPMQCLSWLVWRQENEVVDVASEPLAPLEGGRQRRQIGRVLHLLDRELADSVQAAPPRGRAPGTQGTSS